MYEYENVGEVVVDNNISYSDFLDFWIEMIVAMTVGSVKGAQTLTSNALKRNLHKNRFLK